MTFRQTGSDTAILRPFDIPGGTPSHEQGHRDRSRTHCDGEGRTERPSRLPRGDGNLGDPDGASWELRASADAATAAKPGYPECVAMLVQIGDHLSKQYDVTE